MHSGDAAFNYNLAYSRIPFAERLRAIWVVGGDRFAFVLLPVFFSWCIGLYYLRSSEAKQHVDFEHLLKLSLILLPIEVLLASTSGFDYGHYYLTVLPVGTILIAFAAYVVTKVVSLPVPLLSAILLLAVAIYFIPIELNGIPSSIRRYTHDDGIMHGRHLQVAERIESETVPSDTILVWGAESKLYLLSGRDAPTRYFYQYPLILPGYSRPAIFDEFLSDVKAGNPEFIIDTRNSRLPPLNATELNSWEMDTHRYVYSPDAFSSFLEFVDKEYEFIDEIEGYAIYRRVQRGTKSSSLLPQQK